MRRRSIYVLIDPRYPGAIRYVGYSQDLEGRLRSHIYEASRLNTNTKRLQWIRRLMSQGVRPEIISIDSRYCDIEEINALEIQYIKAAKDLGHDLTNTTEGGDGPFWCSDEARLNMSLAKKGKPGAPKTTDWKAKLSASQKNKPRGYWSEERKAAHAQRLNDPLTKERMRASAIARCRREKADT